MESMGCCVIASKDALYVASCVVHVDVSFVCSPSYESVLGNIKLNYIRTGIFSSLACIVFSLLFFLGAWQTTEDLGRGNAKTSGTGENQSRARPDLGRRAESTRRSGGTFQRTTKGSGGGVILHISLRFHCSVWPKNKLILLYFNKMVYITLYICSTPCDHFVLAIVDFV